MCDLAGQNCLNDRYRAAGGEARNCPPSWLPIRRTGDIRGTAGNPAGSMATINEGVNNGTFVAKELVYDHAM